MGSNNQIYAVQNRGNIITLRKRYPCMTLAAIGRKVGLSRERVRQILVDENVETKRMRQSYICLNCRKIFIPQPNHRRKSFCSAKCYHEYHSLILICEQCGKPFERLVSRILDQRQKHTYYFCSKICYGRWLGIHYGRGRNKQ